MQNEEELTFFLNKLIKFGFSSEPLKCLYPVNMNDTTLQHLYNQVGIYPQSVAHGVVDLDPKSKDLLFANIEKYKSEFLDLPPDYYRKQFINHIIALSKDLDNVYQGSEKDRKIMPETATISATDLLDSDGLKLYQSALKEEMYSYEYRIALFNQSTRFIEGRKWKIIPALIISGPSACGKSFATDAVIRKMNELPKCKYDNSGNLFACIDGEICREVSQMRKLAIRLANLKGYTGIIDLSRQSEILDLVKENVKAAALNARQFGLVIPETYSTWINPFGKDKEFIVDLTKSERQLIFCMVAGHDEENFQEVVYHMGARRAWKTEGFSEVYLDLNATEGLAESKQYGPSGFHFGKSGSQSAFEAYQAIQEQNNKWELSIKIVNDLILLRKTAKNPETWIPAKTGEPGVLLISQQVYQTWLQLDSQEKRYISLELFSKTKSEANLLLSSGLQQLLVSEPNTENRNRFFTATFQKPTTQSPGISSIEPEYKIK